MNLKNEFTKTIQELCIELNGREFSMYISLSEKEATYNNFAIEE